MTVPLGSIRSLRSALANDRTRPTRLAEQALANANQNENHNTYIWRDPEWTRAEAERIETMPRGDGGPFGDGQGVLWGLPIAVKDCFDLAGAPTSSGVKLYRDRNGIAEKDSWLVERLRAEGAVITGKTHLAPLAYGITGQNPDFGDCTQPGNPSVLTGGSSSGAAASVLEGSAVAAIGTDTGGSVRAPAALCGLAGYRASLGRGDWRGGAHLAESFDTMGWLFGDLEEGPLLASFFAEREPAHIRSYARMAIVSSSFLHDCEPEIIESYHTTVGEFSALGMQIDEIDVEWWSESTDIFAPIQAWEAAALHNGNFDHFDESVRQRLQWGERITPNEIGILRKRHEDFRARMDDLLAKYEMVMLPAIPVRQLAVSADHSQTRTRLLRYTTPLSLAGVPTVTIPCKAGGMQIAAASESDEALLQVVAVLGARRKATQPI